MLKRYYIFPERAWKACGTIDIDTQASDTQMIGHLKSMGYLDAGIEAGEVKVLRPKVGDVLLLQYHGTAVIELCAA